MNATTEVENKGAHIISTANPAGESSRESDAAVLHADLLRTKQELRQVQDEYDEYTQSSHELEQELEQELSRAEKKSAALSTRAQQLEFDLDSTRAKLESVLQQTHKFERELSALRDELAAAVADRRRLEQEQDDLVTQVRILQATEDDLRHKVERELEEKVFLVSDQEELAREHELAAERFRTEIVDLKSELYALQQKCDDDDAAAAAARDAARDNSSNSSSARPPRARRRSSSNSSSAQWHPMDVDSDSNDRNRSLLDSASDENTDEDDSVYLHRRRSTVHERDAASQETLIESLRREIDVLSARVQDEIDARNRVEAELLAVQSSAAHVASMETEMREMTDEVIAKAHEIRTRDVEIQVLQQQTTSLKIALAAQTAANAELHSTCDDIQHQLAAKRLEIETIVRAMHDADARCNALSINEIRLTTRLETEVEAAAALTQHVTTLTASVADERQQRLELEAQIDASRSAMGDHERQVATLERTNTALQNELARATQKATELERATAVSAASSSDRVSGDATNDPHRLVLELQALRTQMQSLHAENARLRSHEGLSSDLEPTKQVSASLLTINFSSEQLARKYLAERTRNASLLSRLQTVCGNIQVFCRVRPVIVEELQKQWGSRVAVNVINHSDVAVMDIKADRVFGTVERTIDGSIDALALDALESSASWKVFTFDRILGPEETQNDVFREVEPLAQSVVDGFKGCIFAYGQTGSGKTYTMEGTKNDPGLNYRVVRHIFQSLQLRGAIVRPATTRKATNPAAHDDDVEMIESKGHDHENDAPDDDDPNGSNYYVQVGVLEIYNETLRDLINVDNSKSLEIRHDSATGDICVPELTMATVVTPDETINVLRRAQANRITGQTNVHARSSRSHCVVIVQIGTSTRAAGANSNSNAARDDVCGKLYLVDLAGSECVKHSNVSGEMLREAAHINKSLSALADVMEALDKKLPHVPYRNSKLTFLLQDVLHSSCKTVMIVNVGPTYETASETSRSLQLAERVRHIVVGRNSIAKNKKDILSAKRAFSEIQTLKQQLQISARKCKQAQQSVVAMRRDQRNQTEKQSASLQQRIKTTESQTSTYKTQNDVLKRLNDEMSEQLKLERDARQREVEQRETAQRMLRQLTAKTRVTTSHHESLESLLKDREAEIRKLRHLVTEARQRSTTALIPRLGSPAVASSKRNSMSSINDNGSSSNVLDTGLRTNQMDENQSPALSTTTARPHAKTLGAPSPVSSSTLLTTAASAAASAATGIPPVFREIRKRTRVGTKPRTEAPDATATTTTQSNSPVRSTVLSSSSIVAAAAASRTRRATSLRSTPSEPLSRIWK